MINQKIIDNAPEGAEYWCPIKCRYYRQNGNHFEFLNNSKNWEPSVTVDKEWLVPLHPENWTEEEENRMSAIEQNGNCGAPYNVESTLQERGNRYGDFKGHARITQSIKHCMKVSPNWDTLPTNMQESLEMIAHKIGRILNGDPNYADSWHDISGYAQLIERELEK